MNIHFRQDFEDVGIDEDYFERLFAQVIQNVKENNTVLYCGEYGMIDRFKLEDAMRDELLEYL